MSSRPARPLLLAAFAWVAMACFARPTPVAGAPEVVADSSDRVPGITEVVATLIVENERMVDYRIYLTRQGGERLGLVSGPGRSTFLLKRIQLPHTGDLRVVAVPIAAREALLGTANVPRGGVARFRIMPNGVYMTVDPPPMPKDTTEVPDSTAKPPLGGE